MAYILPALMFADSTVRKHWRQTVWFLVLIWLLQGMLHLHLVFG